MSAMRLSRGLPQTTTTPRAHVRGDAHVHGPNNYNNLCHDAAALGLMAPSHGNTLTILWRLAADLLRISGELSAGAHVCDVGGTLWLG